MITYNPTPKRSSCYFHFADEDIEAQGVSIIFLITHINNYLCGALTVRGVRGRYISKSQFV